MYIREVGENSEYLKEPDNNSNHNHNIKNILDFAVHRNVIIDKPEKNSCNN
jgi:hypothetical protein